MAVVVSDIEIFRVETPNGSSDMHRHRILPRTSVEVKCHKTMGGSQGITIEVDCVDLCITFNTASLVQKLMGVWYMRGDAAPEVRKKQSAEGTPRKRRSADPSVSKADSETIANVNPVVLLHPSHF